MPTFVELDTASLPPGSLRALEVEGQELVLCNAEGTLHVLANRCSHAAAPLHEGRLRGHVLWCPLHGGSVRVDDGSPQSAPIRRPVATFPVREVPGGIEIELGTAG